MPKLVMLLRAINVGGRRKVPMDDLRALCEELGFTGVATYIQSGNLVLATPRLKAAATAALTTALEARFGFPVEVVARTGAEWSRLVAANPFPAASAAQPGRVILHLGDGAPPEEGVAALAERAKGGEELAKGGGALWVHYPRGQGTSRLAPALIDRLLGMSTTGRNWTTVLALDALLAR